MQVRRQYCENMEGNSLHIPSLLLSLSSLFCLLPPSLHSFNMTTSTDDSLDISAQLFWQSTTPTSSATQTKSMPVLSQSGSTSAPDIHTSCPTRASRSATGKKNLTWLGANVLHLVTILYNSKTYHHALLPSWELAESNPALKLRKHPIFQDISKMIFPGASVDPNHIKSKLRWLLETYYREKKKLSPTGAGTLLDDMDSSNPVSFCDLCCLQ